MVDTGSYTWDMALLSRSAHNKLVTEGDGYLEELNLDTPGIQEVPERFRTPYYVGNNVFTAILAYRTDAFEGREPPKNWQDFWDVEGFPGRRALRKHPIDTMEEALLADGVPSDQLYPLDLDRAFASLDRINDQVAIWWKGGAQTSQLLKSGEVDICPTWNARAQAAIDDGAPVKIIWHNNLYSSEGWCIIKGTPNADLGREFIKLRGGRRAAGGLHAPPRLWADEPPGLRLRRPGAGQDPADLRGELQIGGRRRRGVLGRAQGPGDRAVQRLAARLDRSAYRSDSAAEAGP